MEFKYAKKNRRGVEYIFIETKADKNSAFFTKRFQTEHIIFIRKQADGKVELNPLLESDQQTFFDFGSFPLDWMLECHYENMPRFAC